ncbi:MAG: hypothetical protein WDA16_03245 [Candidatus Thermoplasmatota archaeon]
MVRRSQELADVEAKAGLPYEETRLARQAVASRKRLAALLVIGALAMLAAAWLPYGILWLPAAAATLIISAGVWKGKLGGVIAAALVALLAVMLPLAMRLAFPVILAPVVLGAACLPDVVLLMRDAELQHAYGRWARRGA